MRRRKGQFADMKAVPVILDLGHSELKAIVGDDPNRRDKVPHALNELEREKWNNLVEVGHNSNPDYIQVGTRYFEVGHLARDHSFDIQRGNARYTRAYYGTLMCQMVARLFEPDEIQGAVVFASYPPGDRRHVDDLRQSLIGPWEFHHMGQRYEFVVQTVVSYTEPLGGFWNFVIQEDEQGHYDNPQYNPKRRTLVVDFGGGTLSILPIGEDQHPDYAAARSLDVGFNDIARLLAEELRANYRDEFRYTRTIPTDLLYEALRTGNYYGGGRENDGLDVSYEVNAALAQLLERFRVAYQAAGGAAPYGQIILTGGGSIVLGERLKTLMNHRRVFYAHEDVQQLAFANVTGGLKAYREMVFEGVL